MSRKPPGSSFMVFFGIFLQQVGILAFANTDGSMLCCGLMSCEKITLLRLVLPLLCALFFSSDDEINSRSRYFSW